MVFFAWYSYLGRDYHALVTLVVFLLPEETLVKQNRERQHSVADSVLYKQLDSYQFPLPNEVHQYQVVSAHGQLAYRTGHYAD